MEYRILGPLEVVDGDGAVLAPGRPKERALLAYLLIRANHIASVDAIVDALWGDEPPASAANLVQGYVSRLRKLLNEAGHAGALATNAAGYVLHVMPDELDARRFEALAREGHALGASGRAGTAARRLRDALALWRGPALAEMADAPFATIEIARLEQLRIAAVEDVLAAELALGNHAAVVAEVSDAVARYPNRERFWAHLMVALYRCGRQADALGAYTDARRYLVEELGLDPGRELQDLERAILTQDPALDWVAPLHVTGNVAKPLTRFIGRVREQAAVRDLITDHRLVTLTGTGGCGKTRLAVEVATQLTEQFADGIWLAELAVVSDGASVPVAVADLLGVREESGQELCDTIAASLAGRDMLLILDNCEHVVAAVASLVEILLLATAGLRILATSREPLGVPAERHWVVPTLALSAPGDGEDVMASEAVELFVDRATSASVDFQLTAANAAAVARICRDLDGIPLAIELAAARIATMPASEIAQRLGQQLLSDGSRAGPTRQRTLHASIDWSYQLLTEAERELFASLSVLAGEFGLVEVERLAQTPDAVGVFARLVTKSLIVRESAGEAGRYRMLQTLRDYARSRLEERGEVDAVMARHASIFLQFAEEAEPHLFGPTASEWLRRLDGAVDNFRVALAWAFAAGPPHDRIGARLAGALWFYWHLRGSLGEGRTWLEAALSVVESDDPEVRSAALVGAGVMASGQGDLDAVRRWASEALDIATATEDAALTCIAASMLGGVVAWAFGNLDDAERLLNVSIAAGRPIEHWCVGTSLAEQGRVALDRGDLNRAAACMQEGLAWARHGGFDMGIGLALDFLAVLARAQGDAATAYTLCQESLVHYRAIGYREGIASTIQTLARLAAERGDVPEAAARFRDVLDSCRRVGHRGGVAAGLEGIARVLAEAERPEVAVHALAAAAALREQIGAGHSSADLSQLDALSTSIRALLGDGAWSRAWAIGAARTMHAAVGAALSDADELAAASL